MKFYSNNVRLPLLKFKIQRKTTKNIFNNQT